MQPFFRYLLECVGMSEMSELSIPTNKAKLISYISSQIESATKAYESGTPIMTDADYDSLESELRKLDPKNKMLLHVISGIAPGAKIKHRIAMGSLDKAQCYADLQNWYKTLGDCGGLIVSDKLDGISVDLLYVNGKLKRASTRGDGTYGEDITQNALVMGGVFAILPESNDFSGNIRGEILITKNDFAKYFPGESNSRNSAAGAAKRMDTTKARHCTVLCYRIIPESGYFNSKQKEFSTLVELGFNVPTWNLCKNIKEVEDYYKYYIDLARDALGYEIDGLVIEVDDNHKALEIGTDPFHPEYAIAYKFPHATAEATIENIIWQVGKTGRVTPVGVFSPVILVGAVVTRASLATMSFVANMNLGKGDIILVSRRNDVIPKIERVIKESNGDRFEIPYLCPSCGSDLVEDGEYLICTNIANCKAQVEGVALNWLKKIGVLEWGDKVMEDLNADNMLCSIADLYKISERQLAAFVGNKRAKTMLGTLNAKKNIPLHVFVGSLGIKGIGRTNVKSIVDAGYDTIVKMKNATMSEISSVPGMGSVRARDFVSGMSSMNTMIDELQSLGIKIVAPKSGTLSGKSFCLTGFRDAELSASIENSGGVIKSSVGQGLTYLVQKDAISSSEKTKKALSYGTIIISRDVANEMVR